jgi:hypothetical protein
MKTDIRNILASKTKQALSSNILNASNIRENVVILEELQSFIPPLSADEYKQLESNILQHGCQTPIQVWQTSKKNIDLAYEKEDDLVYILVDGHNRFKICTQHKLQFEIYILSFESKKDAKDYMINLQLGRRNLSQNQISYFRGLRYSNEKADKSDNLKANFPKGQNDPSGNFEEITNNFQPISPKGHFDPSTNNESIGANLQSLSPKGQNDPSGNSTAERLAKEYNVSPKTIKRDAEFAEGLEKIIPELRNDILEGKVKIDKGAIQKLSKNKIETPIKSIHELTNLADKKTNVIGEVKEKKLSERVRECVKNADDFDLTITIKGKFLMKNNLETVWRKLRGIKDDIIIDESFTDTISIYQATILGIIEKL